MSRNPIIQMSSSVYYVQQTPLGTNSPKPNQTIDNVLSIYILSTTGLVVLFLCLSVGLTAVCIWRAALAKKHVRSKSPTDSSSGEYDDIVGPVYETITTPGDSACDARVSMTDNEAYKSIIHFKKNKFPLSKVDLTNGEVKHTVETTPMHILMEKSSHPTATIARRNAVANSEIGCENTLML